MLQAEAPQTTRTTENQKVLSGTVRDPSGADIVGAEIQLEHGSVRAGAVSDAAGHFTVSVAPGSYLLVVTAPGFEPLLQESFTISVKATQALVLTLKIATANEVVSVSGDNAGTAADNNGSALVFNKDTLATLSDDDATLQQQLLAIAGGDGQHAPQVYVDGFSGGRFPPKSAIREVRINQNPYSAQYDGLGFGRVEIFTKPGSDKLHGFFQMQGNDNSFNSRNPFVTSQPDYHTLLIDGNVSGPLGKKTSVFGSASYRDQQNNAIVNATVLDNGSQTVPLSQAVPNPQTSHNYSTRVDRQLTTNNTFTARYEYNQNLITNGGVGLLTLASEGFNNTLTTQTLQAGNTQVIGAHRVNETRFQYMRTRLAQTAISNAPTLIVQGAFNGGGAPSQALRDNQDRYEFQDYFSLDHGAHFLRLGARYRLTRDSNQSTANYNGQYTFPDLATYQLTQQGLAAGLNAAQIRALGGGATQFNLTAGQPRAVILTGDIGLYAEDEWKVRKDLTLDLGFRFESQSAIPDHSDASPRVGFAWAVHQGDKRPAWLTVRGGLGLFYERFDASNLLQAVRQNGTTQQSFFVQNPDFYPAVPSPASLTGIAPTVYQVAPRFRSGYDIASGLTLERSLGKIGSITVNYLNIRSVHEAVSLNANAPLPGTFNPAVPNSGVRPLGGTQNLYQFSSEGMGRGNILFSNYNLHPVKWLTLWGFYINQHFNSDFNGATNFVSNSYNVAADYGRGSFDITNRLFTGGTITLPFGVSLDPFLIARGGRTFNITTGSDLNGDSLYNDRPAFATDLTRSSVVQTAFGNFDTNPLPTQRIVPINYGTGPAFISLQLQLSKSIKFGPRPPVPPPDAAVSTTAPATAKSTSGKPGPAPRPDPRYELGFSAEAQNVFNHVNGAIPIGVLSSPSFGKSLSLEGGFFNNSAANRTINLRAFFRF